MRIAVLGGGVSGLAAAFQARRRGHEATVFEAGPRAGGNIRSERVGDCLVEWGPNGFLDNEPRTLELARELGLESRLVRAREEAALRFIWRAGKLRALPGKPPQFLRSDCLPLGARLRVLLEPFARKAPAGDESIHAFAARRLGRGAADILVDAFVTGVFAGDPRRLSVRSAFPKLHLLEREHGSLIRGARGRGFGPAGVLTSFDGGLQTLVDALAKGADLRTGVPAARIERGDHDRVVCTIPAARAAPLLGGELGDLLARIPFAPVAVVAMVFREPLPVPDAFGFLAPRDQGLRILGTLYDSSIFPGRAPKGLRLFRTMVGGRRDPEAAALPDGELVEIVSRDLRRVWGALPEPMETRVLRHPLGIAQYETGHGDLLAMIEALAPSWLRLAGASYRGVSINLCVKEALDWTP
jgi:oxygen-dependent protoporphyrinogen oxidase